jgi:hypothetical protein
MKNLISQIENITGRLGQAKGLSQIEDKFKEILHSNSNQEKRYISVTTTFKNSGSQSRFQTLTGRVVQVFQFLPSKWKTLCLNPSTTNISYQT